MEELTEFVGVFPQNSLRVALAFIQGKPVSKKDIGLAALNIESYAMGLFLKDGEPIPMGAIPPVKDAPTLAHAEAALKSLLPDDDGTHPMAAAGIDKGKWLEIIKTILPLIIGLL